MKKLLLLLFLGVTLFSYSQEFEKCGTWRWSVKTLTDAGGEDILSTTPVKTTINEMNKWERPEKVTGTSGRFTEETKLVKFRGYIIEHKRVEGSGDHDYHIVIQSPDGTSQLITEIPHPECPEVFANETMHELFTQLRETYNEYIGTPTTKIKALEHPVEVEVVGVPFWDLAGHGGGHSENGIEIHPITSIKVISDGVGLAETRGGSTTHTAGFVPPSSTPSDPLTPLSVLILILVGGILGTVGQLIRVIVGLKKAADSHTETDYRRTAFSLMLAFAVGGVSGVLAAINMVDTGLFDKSVVIAFLAAGYAGTDFIEGFMKKTPVK